VLFEGTHDRALSDDAVTREGVLTFIDPNLGGSGYLERFADRLPDVAAAALAHLDHADCEAACYRCLKSYENQRHHELLRWAGSWPSAPWRGFVRRDRDGGRSARPTSTTRRRGGRRFEAGWARPSSCGASGCWKGRD